MGNRHKPGLFSSVKGKVAIVVAFIAGFAAFLGNLTSIKNFFVAKPATFSIEGILINSNNNPVNEGRISLYLWSNTFVDSFNTFSDKSGTFKFPDILKKKYDSLRLEAFWKSKNVFYQNKFDVEHQGHISLTLPSVFKSAAENPLVYHYYWLKGHAIDYLLEEKIDSSWETQLSKHPYIIKNGIFKMLSFLQSQFSVSNDYPELTRNFYKIKNGKKISGKIAPRYAPKKLLTGTVEFNDPEIIGVKNDAQITLDKDDMVDLMGEKLATKLMKNSGEASHLTVTKEKFDKIVEINGHYNDSTKLIDLFAFITRNNYPDDFIEAEVAYNECAGGFTLQLFPPVLSVQIALIQNRDNGKIYSLGDFNIAENSDTVLRPLHSLNSSVKTITKNYFSAIKMTSDDKILIPLKILLKTHQGNWFEYGPSDSLVSQKIDEDEYIVRNEPQQIMDVFNSYEGGSCPYIFSRNIDNEIWQKEDHILYGFHNKLMESEQIMTLKRYNGSLQIRELDPETSYIDEVCIRNVLPNGVIEILRPDKNSLMHRDSKYLILHRGEKLEINFKKKIKRRGIIQVVAYGYYIREGKR